MIFCLPESYILIVFDDLYSRQLQKIQLYLFVICAKFQILKHKKLL